MKSISEMTIDELKSQAYDQLVMLENIQNNLRILNLEIKKRGEVKDE
jgi:hypothetical protein